MEKLHHQALHIIVIQFKHKSVTQVLFVSAQTLIRFEIHNPIVELCTLVNRNFITNVYRIHFLNSYAVIKGFQTVTG